jgi:hypothetical protein
MGLFWRDARARRERRIMLPRVAFGWVFRGRRECAGTSGNIREHENALQRASPDRDLKKIGQPSLQPSHAPERFTFQ